MVICQCTKSLWETPLHSPSCHIPTILLTWFPAYGSFRAAWELMMMIKYKVRDKPLFPSCPWHTPQSLTWFPGHEGLLCLHGQREMVEQWGGRSSIQTWADDLVVAVRMIWKSGSMIHQGDMSYKTCHYHHIITNLYIHLTRDLISTLVTTTVMLRTLSSCSAVNYCIVTL